MGRAKGIVAGVGLADPFVGVMGGRRGTRKLFLGVYVETLLTKTMTAKARDAAQCLVVLANNGHRGEILLELRDYQHSPAISWLKEQIAYSVAGEIVEDMKPSYQSKKYLPPLVAQEWQTIIEGVQKHVLEIIATSNKQTFKPKDLEKEIRDEAMKKARVCLGEEVTKAMVALPENQKAGMHEQYLIPGNRIIEVAQTTMSKEELFSLVSQDGWSRVLMNAMNPQAFITAQNDYKEILMNELKLHHPEVAKTLEAHDKKIEENKAEMPSMAAANLLRARMEQMNLTPQQIAVKAGVSLARVKKYLKRSVKERTRYDSGKVGHLDNSKKICSVLGVDWAVIYLANLSLEMGAAEKYRTKSGRLYAARYKASQECIAHLRKTKPRLTSQLDEIEALVEGTTLPSLVDDHWQLPFKQLLRSEEVNLGFVPGIFT